MFEKKECVVHMLTYPVLKSGDRKQVTAGGWWRSHCWYWANEGR